MEITGVSASNEQLKRKYKKYKIAKYNQFIYTSFTAVTYLIAELSDKYFGAITSRAGHNSRYNVIINSRESLTIL